MGATRARVVHPGRKVCVMGMREGNACFSVGQGGGGLGKTSQKRCPCVASHSDAEEMRRKLIILCTEREEHIQSLGGQRTPFSGAWEWVSVAEG